MGGRDAHPDVSAVRNDGRSSVGGWLLVLCFFLAVWQPLSLALVAANVLAALPVRGWPLALLLAARVVVTACGLAAALAIYHRHAGAMVLAVVSLTLSAGVELFVYTTSYYPNNRLPGDTPWYVAWSIVWHGTWLAYLFKSARVRQALSGDDLPVPQRTSTDRDVR
jgi:hypothetical protein